MRETERDRDRERQRETETEIERQRETDRQRQREIDRLDRYRYATVSKNKYLKFYEAKAFQIYLFIVSAIIK